MGRPNALFRLALCLACSFVATTRAQAPAASAASSPASSPATNPITSEDTWMSVLLGGRKIGSLHVERQRDGQTVTTTQTLSILLTRNGKSIPLGNTSRSVETPDGRPLGFGARTTMSAMALTTASARVSNNCTL